MSVLYIALPIALLISLIAVIVFLIQVRSGQFDDLETPPIRILFDDVEPESLKEKAADPPTDAAQTGSNDESVT